MKIYGIYDIIGDKMFYEGVVEDMSILEALNEEQREAAAVIDGPLLILAGAGSGKTRTVTYRIAHMVKEKGISPYSILAVTFTNKAAKEMKERVEKLVGEDAEKLTVSTFHSFGVRLLRIYGAKIGYSGNFNIYDTDDQKRLVSKIMTEQNIPTEKLTPAKVTAKIGKLKEEEIFPADFEKYADSPNDKRILQIYTVYQKVLKENNALDFADILIYTNELLNNKEVLESIQNRYKYVMVDEYQDTNKVQYNIIKKIADKHRNICVVGDEDQSIYGFRGADIRNILNFEKDYKQSKIIKLERNYRSTATILDAANNVIKNNKTTKGKKLWTDKSSGDPIMVYEAESGIEEADYVAKTIKSIATTKYKYRDCTILYRTNAQSRQFEDAFRKLMIPYKLYGGVQFYQRKEVKDVFAYLNVINNHSDNLSLLRIINVPARGIGDKTIEKLENLRVELNVSLYDILSKIETFSEFSGKVRTALMGLYAIFKKAEQMMEEQSGVSDIVNTVVKMSGYIEMLNEDKEEERIQNINELKNSIYELEKNSGEMGLSEYLEKISLASSSDDLVESDDYVKLMTIHTAKGLEFPVVFLVGMEEELFPGAQASFNDDEVEEERRLCYVAITRAMEMLYITYAGSRVVYGVSSFMREPSRFLAEIPEKYLRTESNSIDSYGYKNVSLKNISDLKKEIAQNKDKEIIDTRFSIGDYVFHDKFGEGRVKNVEKDKVLIYFPSVGEKKFMSDILYKIVSKVQA